MCRQDENYNRDNEWIWFLSCSGYIKRLMKETDDDIEELTKEIKHDIEVRETTLTPLLTNSFVTWFLQSNWYNYVNFQTIIGFL